MGDGLGSVAFPVGDGPVVGGGTDVGGGGVVGGGMLVGGGGGVGDGGGLGFGLGDGLGDGEGLGEGDGLGEGGGLGDGLGDGVGEAIGPILVFLLKSGVTKSSGCMFFVASTMKSCQISAGIVPPNTSATPSMSCMGLFPLG